VRAAAKAATAYTGVFPGTADQVSRARREVARHLAGHPVTDDAVLIVSELAANAILHSHSKGQYYTVRAEVHATFVWLEVEDLGGPWNLRPRDPARPHGLDLVEALTGPDNWGVDGDEGCRAVWARLETDRQR
jgi:serine/threonine-protein kinase RsbW